MPCFALALSTALSTTPITPTPANIRSSCHCGSLVIDVSFWNWNWNWDWNPDAIEKHENARGKDICARNCHCGSCRRYHTGAFVSFLETDSSRISVRSGRDKIGKYPSTCKELGPVERWFCRDCSSKLLTIPRHLSASLEKTAVTDGGSDSSANEETDPIERTTKCRLNLGPVVEDGIPPDVTNSWREQLERPENNLHSGESSAIWTRALPVYYDGGDEDEDGDNCDCYDHHDEYPRALPNPLKWSGGCACGACRYDFVLTHPTELQHCYCHLCRELSGSPFMTWIPVEQDDFHWTIQRGARKEEDESSPLQLVRTTSIGSRHICAKCRSVMTIVYDEQPDHVWPCAGSLDDATLPETSQELGKSLGRVCHICCRYHPTWLTERNDGMERMEEAC